MATLMEEFAEIACHPLNDANVSPELDEDITYAEWVEIIELLNRMHSDQ